MAKALVGVLIDIVTDVARAAADSLAELRDPTASAILLPLVTHPCALVRTAIFCALKALQVGGSLGPAVAALDDSDPAVRAQAVGVIGYLKLTEALPSLIHATKDDIPMSGLPRLMRYHLRETRPPPRRPPTRSRIKNGR
ncbi:hypothetical protein AAE026_14130 [Bradyrhizobium sp. DN5]